MCSKEPAATIADPSHQAQRSQTCVYPACGPVPRSRRRTRPPSAESPCLVFRHAPGFAVAAGWWCSTPALARNTSRPSGGPSGTRCTIRNRPARGSTHAKGIALDRPQAARSGFARGRFRGMIPRIRSAQPVQAPKWPSAGSGWTAGAALSRTGQGSSRQSSFQYGALVGSHARFDVSANVRIGMAQHGAPVRDGVDCRHRAA